MPSPFYPYLVIAGPTASGKTALSIQVAQRLGGEVVCADSMQIYSGVTVGTARPTEEEMAGIPHHLFGFLPLADKYSVARYLEDAKDAVESILARNKTPILCGGTGLYIQSFMENRQFFEQEPDASLRSSLLALAEMKGPNVLWQQLRQVDPESAARLHPNDIHRVIRALEIVHTTGHTIGEQDRRSLSHPSRYSPCLFVLDFHDRERLYNRIHIRVDGMLENGLLDEARRVLDTDRDSTVTQAIGYKEFERYFSGEITLEEAAGLLKQQTRRYAKRQLSWFRRMSRRHTLWVDDVTDTEELTEQVVSIYHTFCERRGSCEPEKE